MRPPPTESTGSLAQYEAAIYEACFAKDPPSSDASGMSPERLQLYRQMVRARLLNHIKTILPTASASCEGNNLQESFDEWLDTRPPRSPLFRDVPTLFAAYLLSVKPALHASRQQEVLDSFRWEAAKWEASHRRHHPSDRAPGAFAFDRVPVLHGSVQFLRLRHSVFRQTVEAGDFSVCVYRRESLQTVYTWELGPLAATLLEQIEHKWNRTFHEVSSAAASVLGRTLNESFVSDLADVLTQFDERGILLGSVDVAD